jgi:hypothetical protein
MPPTIRRLIFDRVTFTTSSFIDLLSHTFLGEDPISLSVRTVGISTEDVSRVFSGLPFQNHCFQLSELFWDNNAASSELFDLLQRCPYLTVLSIVHSLSNSDRQTFKSLANLLATTNSLTEIRFDNNNLSPSSISVIFHGIRVNRSLRRISMSQNSINEMVLLQLKEVMLSNRVVDYIDLREGDQLPPNAIANFVLGLEERGKPLKAEFGKVDPPTAMLLKQLQLGNPDVLIPIETIQKIRGGGNLEFDDGKTSKFLGIPAIDDTELLNRFEEEFSIPRLIENIRKE